MHTIIFALSLYITLLLNTFHGVASTTVDVLNRQLLPDGFSSFGNFEILSIQEEDDEDVVQIRKRGEQEDCESDCLNYSGWTTDSVMQCEDENIANRNDDEIPEEYEDEFDEENASEADEEKGAANRLSSLIRRVPKKPKPVKLPCKDSVIDGVVWEGINLMSPPWPLLKDLEPRYKMVYDIGDPTEPLESDWFELKRRDERWTEDLVGRVLPKKRTKRCYAAEHVLEWQLLKIFIEADKDKTESRCAFLYKYVDEIMPRADHDVQAAKDNGKLKSDGHFDYEVVKYEFTKWDLEGHPEPRFIDYLTFQWPGIAAGAAGSPPNPWEYELVLVNEDLNSKKSNVWTGDRIFPEPKVEKNTQQMSNVKANSGTLEWLFVNKYFDDKKVNYWPDNKGTCKAIYRYTTVMNLVQYHNDPYIQEVLRAQVRRIGDAWEYLEKTMLPGTTWKKSDGTLVPFKERGLKKEWLDFMKETHKAGLDALNKALDDKIGLFDNRPTFIPKLKRWDYHGVFRRVKKDITPNCGTETDTARLQKKIDLLVAAKKKLTPADSELKLD